MKSQWVYHFEFLLSLVKIGLDVIVVLLLISKFIACGAHSMFVEWSCEEDTQSPIWLFLYNSLCYFLFLLLFDYILLIACDTALRSLHEIQR